MKQSALTRRANNIHLLPKTRLFPLIDMSVSLSTVSTSGLPPPSSVRLFTITTDSKGAGHAAPQSLCTSAVHHEEFSGT